MKFIVVVDVKICESDTLLCDENKNISKTNNALDVTHYIICFCE